MDKIMNNLVIFLIRDIHYALIVIMAVNFRLNIWKTTTPFAFGAGLNCFAYDYQLIIKDPCTKKKPRMSLVTTVTDSKFLTYSVNLLYYSPLTAQTPHNLYFPLSKSAVTLQGFRQ